MSRGGYLVFGTPLPKYNTQTHEAQGTKNAEAKQISRTDVHSTPLLHRPSPITRRAALHAALLSPLRTHEAKGTARRILQGPMEQCTY